eukprot:6193698-Pleurochrysis_carterae.AAC.1
MRGALAAHPRPHYARTERVRSHARALIHTHARTLSPEYARTRAYKCPRAQEHTKSMRTRTLKLFSSLPGFANSASRGCASAYLGHRSFALHAHVPNSAVQGAQSEVGEAQNAISNDLAHAEMTEWRP